MTIDVNDLAADLKRDEGMVLQAYRDSRGLLTIGIGRLLEPGHGGGITEDEAVMLLVNDINRTLADLDRRLPWWRDMPLGVRKGMANMAFNVGLGGLLDFKRMLNALQRGAYQEAASEALNSRWAQQVGDRAKRIAELFKSGI